MSSTHKKVIVRKMDRDTVHGYLPPVDFVFEGKLELMSTAGTVVRIPLEEIRGVFFVREFGDSEMLQRKTFTSRPRKCSGLGAPWKSYDTTMYASATSCWAPCPPPPIPPFFF